jgi:uncharacterized protein (DUF433 family)
MAPVAQSHIWLDERGVAWIDDTNRKVIEIAMDYQGGMKHAADIVDAYEGLMLPQVHAALAYYLDHQAEFDAEIQRQMDEYERLRAASLNSPLRQRLRKLGLIP